MSVKRQLPETRLATVSYVNSHGAPAMNLQDELNALITP
jgi:hypothetical protein